METDLLDEIITFQFSQDHLETWFSTVRRALGSNDNPSAYEFKYIFRKLLLCNQFVYNGHKSNCNIDNMKVLTVPAKYGAKNMKPSLNEVRELEVEFDYNTAIDEPMNSFDVHLFSYIASTIENQLISKIQRFHKKECSDCLSVFNENAKATNDFMKRNTGKKEFSQPCRSTIDIIKAATSIMDRLKSEVSYMEVLKKILVNLEIDQIYTNSNFNNHKFGTIDMLSHKEQFIIKIIEAYMDLKSLRIGSRITQEERGVYIRHTSRKDVHFAGQ